MDNSLGLEIIEVVEQAAIAAGHWVGKGEKNLADQAVVMKRDRHAELIREIREAGARVQLIRDGDISAALSCAFAGTNIYALMGLARLLKK